ncbi:hypothetical protein KC343_g2708 [Hortaea werneckii]|nr:hypothetical protein KC352_g24410 [Hortaea werneckii]KAI7559387.1 hypothetical protein KC317_g10395 [Hortaea werneckii]KAI7624982.1 hypothetical protein KC346_g1950 [Hortaea werneckii]KAI7633825.1 hypothetical protein KC343_g2708 [Hortaea werneckii]KAI7644700.1 hypothetical protein KC319_g12228 [Hortaea werneckii]
MGQKYSSVETDPKRRAHVRHKIKPCNRKRKSKEKGSASEYTPVGGLPNLSRRRDSNSKESLRSSGMGFGPTAERPGSGLGKSVSSSYQSARERGVDDRRESQMMQRAMGPPGGVGGGGGCGGSV